jgi:hypothetical protein
VALVLADRVKETTNTTGTGTLTLAGAVSGFQSFSAVGNSNTTYYAITSGTDWEVGIGTYTSSGTTLSRDTVLSSSASGAKITVAAGAEVFVTYPASQAIYEDANGNVGIGVTPTGLDLLELAAGTTSKAPLGFTSGSLLTSVDAGSTEYDGTGFYFTQQTTTGRGIIMAPQIVRLNANRTKATNNTTLEAVFDAANDFISLTASTLYYFKGTYFITTSASATAGGVTMGFTFSNAQQNIGYRTLGQTTASGTAQTTLYATAATAQTVTATSTASVAYCIEFEGWFKSNATTGGTLTPCFAQSVVGSTVAPTAVADSWFMLMPMSSNTSATVIAGSWA